MLKKILYTIIIIFIILFIAFNGYKFKIYNEFKGYLSKSYPDKSFTLQWVKYDFFNDSFNARVHCLSDDTDFTIGKGDRIIEQYLVERNEKPINKIIKSYLKNESFFYLVESVTAGVEDIEVLNTKNEIDYSKLVYDVWINYKYNSIENHNQFAEMSYMIISALKDNGVKLNMISFDYERDKMCFNLLLQGNDINSSKEIIAGLIKRLK